MTIKGWLHRPTVSQARSTGGTQQQAGLDSSNEQNTVKSRTFEMSKLSHQDEDVLDTISLVQDGDFEAVREVLASRIVPVNAKDSDHCTLLHWAAINNRIKIANMLIEYGADHIPGGLLNETPLQWALRKRYYKMMSLLIEKLHVDLRHKSTQGFDALHLACRSSDVNGVFLLLSYGANPNSLDNDGNTPLLYLVKSLSLQRATGNDLQQHNRSLDMIRMLLMFGADVLIQDTQDKNTVIHILAQSKLSDVMSIAFYLYQAGAQHFPSIQNTKGATPYKAAVLSENRNMARFLLDILIFNYCPYHLPTFILAVMVCLLVYFLATFSLPTAVISWGLLYLGLSWTLLQSQIVDHRGRLQLGLFAGAVMSLFFSTIYVIFPRVSTFYKCLLITFAAGALYYCSLVIRTKPLCARHESKSELARKIINSSPFEGNDEENREFANIKDGHNKIIKDSFTGKIEIVRSNNAESYDGEDQPKARTLGPKICGHCLCDKRSITYLPKVGAKETVPSAELGADNSVEIISLATHCHYCNQCVVDQDHHSIFLGQCIGKGNRREFVILLVLGSITNFLYFFAMKYIQYYELLPQDLKYGFLSRMFRCEWSLLTRFPHLFFLTWLLAFGGGMLFGFMAQGQLLFVSRETTLSQVIKSRYSQKDIPQKKQMKNLMIFLRTGQYVVAYPKLKSDEKRSSSCCDHHGTKDPEKDAQKQDVESLFSRIEKEMGVDTTSPLSKDELNLALTSTVIKTNSSVHNEDDFRGRSNQPQRDQAHDHRHDHGHHRPMREFDDDDDYDVEFADSPYNSYYDHYHAQEEEDGDFTSLNNNSFYRQQEDEESLLRSRKY